MIIRLHDTSKSAATPISSMAPASAVLPIGSGTSIQDLNRLLKQHKQMGKMMKKMKGKGMQNMMRGMGGALGNGPGGGMGGGMPPMGGLPPGGFPRR